MQHIGLIDQHSRLVDTVYEKLCDAIFCNEIGTGSQLSVPMLASHFGVSRSPIKDAVQQLVTDGIAVAIPRRGVFVREFDESDIVNLLEITVPLESLAGRQAAEHVTDDDLRQLKEILDHQGEAILRSDNVDYARWDSLFHNTIARISRNERLQYFLRILHNQIRLVSRRMLFSQAMLRASYQDHKAVLKALKSRDPARVEEQLRKHVDGSKLRLGSGVAGVAPAPAARPRRAKSS